MKRHKLPDIRVGKIRKAVIAGHEVLLETGNYPDGELGEFKLHVGKEGSEVRLYDKIADGYSLALQYGAPVELIVEHMEHHRTELGGVVQGCDVKTCKSIIDWAAKRIRIDYL